MARKEATAKTLAEIIGAVAVVLGLVFVGFELRSNTRAVEASTFQSLTDISNDYLMDLAANPDLAEITRLGYADLGSLNPADSSRFFTVERAFWVRMQNVYSQLERGTLTEDDWRLYSRVICDESGTFAGRRQLWPQQRLVLSDSFVSFVEDCWDAS
ncbi:MAG: hypothetical protein R3282_00465 [Rhodothermales bacterium]|nr:hypothetical protein [Rhodothermales bacterium]